ncbi:MAG: Gldg family protein [Alphaproteobacteria bacterium]|nr:Gldg family protein [Alphaproteobacteria bacterium]
MDAHDVDPSVLLWFGGWLVAVVGLFVAALTIPLQTRFGGWGGRLYAAIVVAAGVAAGVLANVAIVLNDGHLDLTREKVYTPSAAAMRAVDALDRPVAVTYFYRSQDPVGRRTRDLLEVMGRRNPLLAVRTVDPDKEPTLARTQGIKIYNAAVVEAEGRRVMVQSTDEAEIAIGIQRVLRQRVITACFLEGHGELPMDAMEFHTHLEGIADHSHGEASSQLVEMPGHGIGRLRRALEAQGYETLKVILASGPRVPGACTVAIVARPLATFLPAESAALRAYLQQGGSVLLLLDLGFVLEPELARLVAELGVRPELQVVVDPLNHYMTDAEMVAVTGYDPHPITRGVSLTFFPGVRPLTLLPPAGDVAVTPLLASSRDSYARHVEPPEARSVTPARPAEPAAPPAAGVRVLGVTAEGTLPGGTRPLRAIVVGDGDFASNSFFPYMSNSDLVLAMVRWLVREERTAAVGSRIPVPPLILLTARQTRTLFLLLVVALPLSVVLIGGFVWWRRR